MTSAAIVNLFTNEPVDTTIINLVKYNLFRIER